ncbi:MAG: phenylalanine--tRNA ligase subunit beta [Solirubrobacteraceae bacterium]|nr:phenylalanine--tRNA ligase subunit beta [Solirubrobacteraceae bacterium]
MKAPLSWLGELVDLAGPPALDAETVAHRLNVTGTELDRLLHHGVRTPDTVVVGRVLAADQHPDADRLRVCRVDVGADEPSQIVCGAPNVAAGQVVAVATVGTVMPDGMKIKRAKLRGQASHGMICSARELGIGEQHEGILALDEHLPDAAAIAPGTRLSDVLPHADEVLELEVTPNRPDCLGLYGIAREVSAATGAALRPAPWEGETGPDPAGDAIDGFAVRVDTPRCRRFTARLFADVTVGPSPLWMQARLAAAGQRSINNVVDVTNYVMLVTGQPLHAFDADRIAGGALVVREARDGEALTTLDEEARTLRAGEVVIDDADGPTSLAGVMGGDRSEVHDGTVRVLLEVASWDGPTIHRTAQRLGLFSEAATRNAKGLAPEQTAWAQALATRLLVDLAGARRVGGTIDVGGDALAGDPDPIVVREARVARLLGAPVDRARQTELLRTLGFGVVDPDPTAAEGEGALHVLVPPERRVDVTREIDVVEELARLGVVADLTPTLPVRRRLTAATLSPVQRARRRVEDALVGRGLQEVVGWSFTDAGAAGRLGLADGDPRASAVRLEHPLSEDQAVLRPTILVSLLDVARHNRTRGADDVRIFETGTVFRDQPDPRRPDMPFEHAALGVLVQDDLFAVKGLLDAVLGALRIDGWELEPVDDVAFLHPGRGARIVLGDDVVGLLGEVHPTVADRWGLPRTAVCLLDLDQALPRAPERRPVRPVGQFPDARFDLAVVVADDVSARRTLEIARGAAGPLLEDVTVFDAYRGTGIADGHVSLALHVRLRAADRTLTDEEIGTVREAIVAALAADVGATLRG